MCGNGNPMRLGMFSISTLPMRVLKRSFELSLHIHGKHQAARRPRRREAGSREEKTSSGLYIPDTAKEKPQRGTVVAVGPGRVENGTKIDMSVSEGDTVLYGKYAGTEITIENEDYLIVRESDILGIVS